MKLIPGHTSLSAQGRVCRRATVRIGLQPDVRASGHIGWQTSRDHGTCPLITTGHVTCVVITRHALGSHDMSCDHEAVTCPVIATEDVV